MKKLLCSFFLLLTVVVGRAEDFEVDGIYYNITSAEEHTVEVTYKGDWFYLYYDEYSGDVVIPETVTYEGMTYRVTSIGQDAFDYCRTLTSVVIPNTVTKIENNAFSTCLSLASISIPDSVTEIGDYAFSSCGKDLSITIPSGVTKIGYRVFYGSGLTSITIPNSVTEIGNEAFRTCRLSSISIPNSVTTIGTKAFYTCGSLTSVSIPESVTEIAEDVFSYSGLTSVVIPNSVEQIREYAFENCRALTSVTISKASSSTPGSVTEIASKAFNNCIALTSVTFDNSVINIYGSAFLQCGALETITFGSSVTEVGGEMSVFPSSRNLKDVYCLAESAPVTDGKVFSRMGVTVRSLTLHVPAASLEAYSTTEPWSSFGQIVAIDGGDGIEQLTSEEGNSAFKNPTVYDLNGRRTTKMQKGINLRRNADGRVKKIWKK